MPLSISQKQNILYFIFIILTIFASIITYRLTQQKWLLMRDAEIKFNEKSFNEAIDLYQKSLLEGSTTPKTFLHLADSYIAIGEFSKGIEYYQLYLKRYPRDSSVRLLLARALSWNGQIEEAEKEYQKVLEDTHETKPPL